MTAVPGQFAAPELSVGTPILLMPTNVFPKPMAGYVRAWPDNVPAAVRSTRVPIWLVSDGLDYVAFPNTVVAL